MKITAAVARQIEGEFSLEELNLAEPNEDELLVKIVATGVCHTDLSVVDGVFPLPLPLVLGHEGAGVVKRVGANVTGFDPGDHVVLTFNSCGECDPCAHEHPAYCDLYPALNFSPRRADGSAILHDANGDPVGGPFFTQSSFATHALSKSNNTVKVPQDVPLELLGPLSCGLSTGAGTVMNVLKPRPDSTIAVIGTGAVGMAGLMAAKAVGAERIIAVDRVEHRLELARKLGATHLINTENQDLANALQSLGGISQCLDTSGVPTLISAAVGALRSRGRLALVGVSKEQQVTFNTLDLVSGGKVICGVVNGDCNPSVLIPQLIDMYRDGRFPMDRLAAYYSFDQINQAVADTHSGKTIKPILRMG